MDEQSTQQTKYNLNPPPKKSGKKAVWIVIATLLLAAAAVYGAYYKQQKKIDDVNKVVTKLSAENDDLRYQLKALNTQTIVGAVEAGSAEQKVIKNQLVGFYKNWIGSLKESKEPADYQKRISQVSDQITPQTKAQYDKDFTYDLFTCSQQLPQLMAVDNPIISGTKATVEIQKIGDLGISGNPPYIQSPVTLSLVNQNSKWLIDKVTCPV